MFGSLAILQEIVGKTITEAIISGDESVLSLKFSDGQAIEIVADNAFYEPGSCLTIEVVETKCQAL